MAVFIQNRIRVTFDQLLCNYFAGQSVALLRRRLY